MSSSQNEHAGSVVVCLPTYNESRNIERITAEIFAVLPRARILVIDDNSPDGTGQIADSMAEKNAAVSVLHRKGKEGLGKAYIDGFRHAMENLSAEYIVQMDADNSHPANRLPVMIGKMAKTDLVLGSRYVPGGGVQNWPLHRLMISRFGSWYARMWLGLPCSDLTGGFKVWRAELLEKVIAQPIDAGGYVFQVNTTLIASRLGARIEEVPIIFTDRCEGSSKMSMSIALEAAWRVPMMRFAYKDLHP
ncbi:MAG: polyprenol monophosphomannose synthase [Planctomycetes bacterium]|nr:polyprenol monophosphomannose synthase [Planctomycetota bacterium]